MTLAATPLRRTSWWRSEPISNDMATQVGSFRVDLTDELISFEEAHIDHAYPKFGQLVVSFRAANDGSTRFQPHF